MKKHASILLLLTVILIANDVYANPGDTTWVTIWNQRKLTYYGNYDTSATLPTGKRYRKIRMHYILGTYACPGNPQYCGSWDYTTQIFVKPPLNDTVEIARVITPYATNWLQLGKKHDYVIDVTDYASVLQGSIGMQFGYQGYSYGFHVSIKLEMIEGVPAMDAIKVKNIYNGYFPYGNPGNSIENYLTSKTCSYSSPGTIAYIKNSISGHGADGQNCAEFCNKYYQLKINNNQVAQKNIWRSDCGLNHEYPQTGTWLYERANWCPGAVVWPIYHNITSLTSPNTSFSVDIDMQSYTDNGSAGYSFVSQIVTYSVANHLRDVSIEEIVAPTTNENFFRKNAICTEPIVKIKNTGTNTITSVAFSFGMQGQTPSTYTWNGSLAFLNETDVTLPPSANMFTANIGSSFNVSVTSVNGIAGDEDNFNNSYRSLTGTVNVLPSTFIIKELTNNATDPNTNKNETTYKLYDQNNNLILSRTNLSNVNVYNDTVNLQPGCYKIVVDDAGCDGQSWWAYQYYTPNPGNGSLRFEDVNMPITLYMFNGDFGCNYTMYFRVNTIPMNVQNALLSADIVDVHPNPASNEVYLRVDMRSEKEIRYQLKDLAGRAVGDEKKISVISTVEKLNTSTLPNGVYLLEVMIDGKNKSTRKVVIQR